MTLPKAAKATGSWGHVDVAGAIGGKCPGQKSRTEELHRCSSWSVESSVYSSKTDAKSYLVLIDSDNPVMQLIACTTLIPANKAYQ